MIPVLSTRNAATHDTSGSYSRASAGVIILAGTPLASAREANTCNPGSSAAEVATTSFPHTSCATPLARANSTIERFPATLI